MLPKMTYQEKWQKKYDLYVKFIGEYGIDNVDTLIGSKRMLNDKSTKIDHARYIGLGGWISTQRKSYRTGKLAIYRIKMLTMVGFIWNKFDKPSKTPETSSITHQPVSHGTTTVTTKRKATERDETPEHDEAVGRKKKSVEEVKVQQPEMTQNEMVLVPKQWLMSISQQLQMLQMPQMVQMPQMTHQQMMQQQMMQQQLAQRQMAQQQEYNRSGQWLYN